MGLFGKDRVGTFKATDGSGRHFAWTIPKFSSYTAGKTLDAENVSCFTKTKFHLHMSLGNSGNIGVYIHYKKPPIPKYSYYFENTKGEVMRQHTAHTIPAESERCGHWNVCNLADMPDFLGAEDTLVIRLSFDDDTIVVKRVPEQNTISVLWTVPALLSQYLSPFSSAGFFIDSTLLVMRLDNKRHNPDAIAKYDPADIHTLILFLFSRKGKIPPHSIELVDASGKSYYKAEQREDGAALTAMVEKSVVDQHVAKDGVFFVQINFHTGGNPLEALNTLSAMNNSTTAAAGEAGEQPQTVAIGEKREVYNVMDD